MGDVFALLARFMSIKKGKAYTCGILQEEHGQHARAVWGHQGHAQSRDPWAGRALMALSLDTFSFTICVITVFMCSCL